MSSERRYLVREIFGPTLQGEGYHTGVSCVFLRFGSCNLDCLWCDTDFSPVRSRKLTADEVVAALTRCDVHGCRRVVVTGGEPALQWDLALYEALRLAGFRIHMETNGTRPLAAPVDWLTVSPKPQFHRDGVQLADELAPSELKVIVDSTVDEAALEKWELRYAIPHRFLQPCADAHPEQNLLRTLTLIHRRPAWRLSLQTHKIIGIP